MRTLLAIYASLMMVGCIVPETKDQKSLGDKSPGAVAPAPALSRSLNGTFNGPNYNNTFCTKFGGEWVCQETAQNPQACGNDTPVVGGYSVLGGGIILSEADGTINVGNGANGPLIEHMVLASDIATLSPSNEVWGLEFESDSSTSIVVTYTPGCSILLAKTSE